ncbi:hypothetical protein NDU88_004182 [Pleurodeles waltl]|uniref:Uncharacterized protein n=1 Tax=Pleurodeles waltl TaxID=8319 RepID=A0AAV7MUF7_PLEWA|nr:hypothetical protein NDU88_004182 [Pleurodeles waltl]
MGVHSTLLRVIATAESVLRAVDLRRPVCPDLQQKLLDAKVAVLTERLRFFDYSAYMKSSRAEHEYTGHLLAWLANPNGRGMSIVELTSPAGDALHSQADINACFMSYYCALYTSITLLDDTAQALLLSAAALPRTAA